MRHALVLGLFFLAQFSFAQSVTTSALTDVSPAVSSHWSVEGALQAHSVAGNGSPWLGIAAAYQLVDWAALGLRGYVPVAHTVDRSTYATQVYARARVASSRYTMFFVEPDYAQNFYNFQPFSSYGMAVGALSRITPGISVGVSGGVEVASVVIDSLGLERRKGSFVYPKIALLTGFAF